MGQCCSRYWDMGTQTIKCNSGPYETYPSLGGESTKNASYNIISGNIIITERN